MQPCKRCNRPLLIPDALSRIDDKGIDFITSSLPKLSQASTDLELSSKPGSNTAQKSHDQLQRLWSHLPQDYRNALSGYIPKLNTDDNQGTIKVSDAHDPDVYTTNDIVQILEANSAANQQFCKSFSKDNFEILNNPTENKGPSSETITNAENRLNNTDPSKPKHPIVSSPPKSAQFPLSLKTHVDGVKGIKSPKSLLFPKKANPTVQDSRFSISEKNILDSFILLDKHNPLNLPKSHLLNEKLNCSNINHSLSPSNPIKDPALNQTSNAKTGNFDNNNGNSNGNSPASSSPSLEKTQNNIAHQDTIYQNSKNHLDQNIQTEINPSSKLFLKLETNSIIDHPLCTDCSEKLISLINSKVEDITEEYQNYLDLYQLYSSRNNDSVNDSTAKSCSILPQELHGTNDSELAELYQEYESLVSQDVDYDRSLDKLSKQLELLSEESLDLDNKNRQILLEKNELSGKLASLNGEIEYLQHNYKKQSNLLFNLQQINVYNDLFTIKIFGANGQITNYADSRSNLAIIGVINGFRLGRIDVGNLIPNYADFNNSSDYLVNKGEITWSEINAAWGQCLLLLITVSKRLNYEFENYKLIPTGSFSKIIKISSNNAEKPALELYGSGDFHLGRLFQNRRFDMAMVAFLSCLNEICIFVEKHLNLIHPPPKNSKNSANKIPFPIKGDLIGNVSIKMQFSTDEIWTKALTHMLINCKWLLAFASNFGST